MKKEIVKYTTVCDICENELYDSGIRTNCGKFEEPYFKTHTFDICYVCAGKLFATQIGSKLTSEKLKEMIDRTRKLVNPSNPFGDIPVEIQKDFIGVNPAEVLKGWDLNHDVQNTTPIESTQEQTNNMFKVHPESEMKVQQTQQVQSNSLESIDDPKSIKDL